MFFQKPTAGLEYLTPIAFRQILYKTVIFSKLASPEWKNKN